MGTLSLLYLTPAGTWNTIFTVSGAQAGCLRDSVKPLGVDFQSQSTGDIMRNVM